MYCDLRPLFVLTLAFNLAVAAADDSVEDDTANVEFNELRCLPHTWLQGTASPFARYRHARQVMRFNFTKSAAMEGLSITNGFKKGTTAMEVVFACALVLLFLWVGFFFLFLGVGV